MSADVCLTHTLLVTNTLLPDTVHLHVLTCEAHSWKQPDQRLGGKLKLSSLQAFVWVPSTGRQSIPYSQRAASHTHMILYPAQFMVPD